MILYVQLLEITTNFLLLFNFYPHVLNLNSVFQPFCYLALSSAHHYKKARPSGTEDGRPRWRISPAPSPSTGVRRCLWAAGTRDRRRTGETFLSLIDRSSGWTDLKMFQSNINEFWVKFWWFWSSDTGSEPPAFCGFIVSYRMPAVY